MELAQHPRIGCADMPARLPLADYFGRLDLLEVDVTFMEPPGTTALRRWRKEAPEQCAFTALAWQRITHDADTPGYKRVTLPADLRAQVGSFRATPAVKEAWQRTLEAAQALSAEVVLFRTPAAFTPAPANREAMRRFFAEIDRAGLALAWEPQGIWEPQLAAKLAGELGLIYAYDPLQLEEPLTTPSTMAYFRLYGLGLQRNKISDAQFDVLADLIAAHERAWIVFANTEKYRDAKRFKKFLASAEDPT